MRKGIRYGCAALFAAFLALAIGLNSQAANVAIDGSATVGGITQNAKYSTGTTTTTFTAGQLTGAAVTVYDSTATTPGSIATRTATEMFGDIPNAAVGATYILIVRNSSGSANTMTITAGTGVTLTGTMTIAQTVSRVFVVTLTSATAITIQSVGIFAAGA